jgi:hypothetical protein
MFLRTDLRDQCQYGAGHRTGKVKSQLHLRHLETDRWYYRRVRKGRHNHAPEGHQSVIIDEHTFGRLYNTAYDQGAGEGCSQTINVTVPDNTPVLDAFDDFYENYLLPIEGNVLGNDSGLGLVLDVTGSGSGCCCMTLMDRSCLFPFRFYRSGHL